MRRHTASEIASTEWRHPYIREQAEWPSVNRGDNPYCDRNLFCW